MGSVSWDKGNSMEEEVEARDVCALIPLSSIEGLGQPQKILEADIT